MVEFPVNSFWDSFKPTPGAFSTAEAVALYNIVRQAPKGNYLELGSHKGKSSQVIAIATSIECDLFLVEPEFKDEKWRDEVFIRVEKYIPAFSIFTHADFSLNIIPLYDELSFVFVDSGNHSDDLVMNECKLLEDRVIKDGIIAFHDKGSQFIKVNEAYDYLVSTGKYEPISIDWPVILRHVADNNLEENNQSWHVYPDLGHAPNFVGAVRRK